jgi:hypothetical protein
MAIENEDIDKIKDIFHVASKKRSELNSNEWYCSKTFS